MNWRRLLQRLWRVAGWLFVAQVVFAVTGPPFWLTNWLNAKAPVPTVTPRYIVVLGGGGIPSGSSLIRSYYAAEFGRALTGTTFVVALPTDGNPEHSSVGRMRDELVLRGIPAAKILMESRGLNTREQARNVGTLLGPAALTQPVLVVSSEYHLRRALLYFRKVGFTQLAGLNAAGTGTEADPGGWAGLRYGVWNNLVVEIKMLRELAGLAAGRLMGWL